jgi:hypothetical protein
MRLPVIRRPLVVLALLLASALLALPSAPARAGAWPQQEDNGQIVLTALPYAARLRGFDRFGQPTGQGWDRRVESSIYWEHGLSPSWTIGLQPRLQTIWMNDSVRTTNSHGLAETKVFLRHMLWRGDWDVLAVQGQVAAPGMADKRNPRLAEPNASYEIRALYGHAFQLPRGMSGFVDLQAAFNYRAGVAADEVITKVTAGLRFVPGWLVLLQGVSNIGLRNAGPGGPDYSVHRLLTSVVVDLDPTWQIEVGYLREVAGRRVSMGHGVLAALWYRY